MTADATSTIDGRFEVYRVIAAPSGSEDSSVSYQMLQDSFNDRIEDMNATLEQIDMAGGFAKGNAQKLLCCSQQRWARTLGWESLGKMLKGTGTALVLVIDDERFAPLKAQMAPRRRKREPANAGSKRPAWLITKEKAGKMATKRLLGLTPAQRKKLARKAGKASGRARRKRARAAIVPPAPVATP